MVLPGDPARLGIEGKGVGEGERESRSGEGEGESGGREGGERWRELLEARMAKNALERGKREGGRGLGEEGGARGGRGRVREGGSAGRVVLRQAALVQQEAVKEGVKGVDEVMAMSDLEPADRVAQVPSLSQTTYQNLLVGT